MALTHAVKQLRKEQQRLQSELERVNRALHALDSLGRRTGGRPANGRRRRGPRHMSADARRRIAAAQRARWAKLRQQRLKKAA